MSATPIARLFQGTRDLLPAELIPRNELLTTLIRVFESFGFAPLETPAFEYLDILLGKYGDEGERLIYRLAYRDGKTLALRYDLTVPLSRVVAMHRDLPKPFKRYQIQPVWRADRAQPAQGRFREFIQCDVDTVGTTSLLADAENLAVVNAGVEALGLDSFEIRFNHRRLLRGVVRSAGLPAEAEPIVLRVVDKLDKIGESGVEKELLASDLPEAGWRRVLEVMAHRDEPGALLDWIRGELPGDEDIAVGASELEEVFRLSQALGVPSERLVLDLHLSRGLDYYTGPIYEVGLLGVEKFGSLGGGGRYDDLMGVYGGNAVPATGVSIGLSRVLAALIKLNLLKERQSPSEVLIARFDDTPMESSLALARGLREAGIPCECHYESDRLKKQFQAAERKGIRFLAIQGSRELESRLVNLKDLDSGEQIRLGQDELPAKLKELLG